MKIGLQAIFRALAAAYKKTIINQGRGACGISAPQGGYTETAAGLFKEILRKELTIF